MSSIHGHEVLQMMLASGESWTVASLEAAIFAAALAKRRGFTPVQQRI